MNTIADKIEYTEEAKEDLRNAIEGKRVVVDKNTPLRGFAGKIDEIVLEIPVYEDSVEITSNTTTTVEAEEGKALSKVTATVNVLSKLSSNCKRLFYNNFKDKSGSNSDSATFTLPANKKCFVIIVGTTEDSQTFKVSTYNSVETLYNNVQNYFNQVNVRFTAQVFTIEPSASDRSITVSASGSKVRHLFAYAIY